MADFDDFADPLGISQGAGAGGDDQGKVGQDDFGFSGAGAQATGARWIRMAQTFLE